MKQCKCGLNPNNSQDINQQKFEQEYINKFGLCNACHNEVLNNE